MTTSDKQSKPHKTAILVLGVDDEADRAMMRVLGALGCALPAAMRAGDEAEALGGFEPAAVRSLNERLFDKAGSSWDDASPFHPEWRQAPGAKAFIKHAVTTLEEQFRNAPLIALGGRDLQRLFPLWAEALRLFGCEIRPIIMVRNPLEAAQRASVQEDCSPSLAEMIWIRRALDAERFTRGEPRYFASFERLCRSWDLVVQDAQEALHVVWPKVPANVEIEVGDILGGLQFSAELESRAMTSTLLPQWVRETYKILNGWAISEEMAAHHGLLDALRADFDIAADAFGRVVRAERHVQQRTAEAQREQMQAEIDRLSHGAAAAEQEREALMDERAGLTARCDELAAEQAALQSRLEGLQALSAERDVLAAQCETHAAELAAQLTALQAAQGELKAAKDALQEQRRTTTLLNAQVQELSDRALELDTQLGDVRAELAASRARRKEMARVIANREAQLKARYEELAQLQRQIVRSSPLWQMKKSFGRLKRGLRSLASPAA